MNVNDYGKYNFADMLISIEEEMENHITALRTARKQIGLLWNDCDRMSGDYAILSLFLICIILTIAEMIFKYNIRGISYEKSPCKKSFF